MKKQSRHQLIPLGRLCAFVHTNVGRKLRSGESPLELAAEVLVGMGFARDGKNARKFVESHRDVIFGAKVASATKLNGRAEAVDPDIAGRDFLQTFEWRRVRMLALKKYGARCQCCGATPATGAVMNVDHIKPRKLFPQLALDVNNLQVLCSDCNHGKGNWDMTDWRDQSKQEA